MIIEVLADDLDITAGKRYKAEKLNDHQIRFLDDMLYKRVWPYPHEDYIEVKEEIYPPESEELTMRDQFAMAALTAFNARDYPFSYTAGYAYEIADEMMEARKSTNKA